MRVIDVVVAPEVARTVAAVVARLDRQDAAQGACRRTSVSVGDPATVASGLRAGKDRPDVWIPDSSLWLSRAATVGASGVGDRPSIAATQVVFAVRESLLPELTGAGAGNGAGTGNGAGPLARLVAHAGGTPLRLGLPDAARSAVAAGALLDLRDAVTTSSGDESAVPALMAATLRQADAALTGSPTEMLAQVAGSTEPMVVAVTEQAATAYNATAGRDAAVAVLDSGSGGFVLDFPVVAMSRQRPVGVAAMRLLSALRTPAAQRLLRADGLQAPAAGSAPLAPEVASAAETAVRDYLSITRGARMLAVIDVSGSMGQLVAGAGGATRIDLARRAAAAALPLLPPDSQVGLWEFSTNLTEDSDHREVLPVGAVTSPSTGGASAGVVDRRTALALGVAGLQFVEGGGTALYDTTLAAVREMRDGWDPERVNSVVLLTDGWNDETDGIDLAELLRLLEKEADPRRPVPVIGLVYGPDGDAVSMTAITDATGGSTYVVRDAREIGPVLLDAFGRRTCRPDC